MPSINRRELIEALLGASALAVVGCEGKKRLPVEGELLSPNFALGHRLRDPSRPTVADDQYESVPVVIVGAGISGLSAGWRLNQLGMKDFVILELESQLGGTSRSDKFTGHRGTFQYPWAAHYITTPSAENRTLIDLLVEMGIVESIDESGKPIIGEEFLCREPEERLFQDGAWHEGLYPGQGATEDDLRQLVEFRSSMLAWATKRDEKGRRYFAIPVALSSDAPEVLALDELSMLDWLTQQGWDSSRLHWYVEYACRDDYGSTLKNTSAWAAILYFAARLQGDSDRSQDVITWPQGNGRIVEHLADRVKPNVLRNKFVYQIVPPSSDGKDQRTRVVTLDSEGGAPKGYLADQVIFAAPQFVAQHVIDNFRQGDHSPRTFQYSSWLVANVHLSSRPPESGFPMCWDNIIYDSKSLGYVVSTHQTGSDHGPTVLTWYYSLADEIPAESREKLLRLQWSDWADLVLTDLQIAHPDIREWVERIDVMTWGHAMVQPYPGFVWGKHRQAAAKPDRSVHFANTDLSGIALMEEAFYHGVRAADEVMARRKN
jgi:phytoene dehydrogenase-like protein